MKPERFKRTKSVVATSALALVVAAATFGIASVVVGPRAATPQRLGFELTSGPCAPTSVSPPTFAVCGPGPGTGPVLYPGAGAKTVPLNFYNPLNVGIVVTSLTVSFSGTTFPTGCASSDFSFGGPGVSSTAGTQPNVTLNLSTDIPVSGNSATSPGGTYNATLALADNGNQNACKNLALKMAYTASARYTEVYATSTAVTSSQSPSTVGNSVTYTATVTANATSGQDPVPSSPTGTVTFYDGAVISGNVIVGCSGVAVASATTTTVTATCTSPVYGTTGTHSIIAVYSNTDGNFTGSTSPAFAQTVNPIGTSLVLTSSPSGTALFGQTVTLKASISPSSGPTGTVTYFLGTPSGTHASLGTETLSGGQATLSTTSLPPGTDSLYATYGGATNYAASTSPAITLNVGFSVPCITKNINGGYTVPSGQSICITGRVNGGLTVQAAGSLYLDGATINGGTTSTGARGLRFCGSNINGNLTISGTTGFTLIGDGADAAPNGDDLFPACTGNSINAVSVSITNNTGGVEFGGNAVIGLVSITNNIDNAVGPEVEVNNITGTLSCSGNVAAPSDDGHKNTVTGLKTGQCAGSF